MIRRALARIRRCWHCTIRLLVGGHRMLDFYGRHGVFWVGCECGKEFWHRTH